MNLAQYIYAQLVMTEREKLNRVLFEQEMEMYVREAHGIASVYEDTIKADREERKRGIE